MNIDTYDDESLQFFVEQSLDKLDQIETELVKIEKKPAPAATDVTHIYSLVLALKESASLMEFKNISLIAGEVAKALDLIFKKQVVFTPALLNALIDTFDKLNELVSNTTLSADYDPQIYLLPLQESLKESSGEQASPHSPVHEEEQPSEINRAEKSESSTEKLAIHNLSAKNFRQKYGIKKEVDLASNANPLGVSKAVSNTLINMSNNCCAFENDMSDSLKFGLSKQHDVPEESITIANGAVEILDLALRLSVTPGVDHVLSYEHVMPEYSSVTALCGVELLKVPRSRNFSPPLDQIVTKANEKTAAVIITNPDRPSGYGLQAEELATMANLLPERTLLIVDERLIEFAWPEDDYSMIKFLDQIPNLIILRSFSWSFGMRGVHLGYALLNPEWVRRFEEARVPQTLSPLNVGAGIAALNHTEFYFSTIALIIRGRERVQSGLEELGCSVYPSQSNAIMFSSPVPADELHAKMLEHGFKLRLLDEFGLTDLLTVSIGNNSQNRVFLAAIKNILSA